MDAPDKLIPTINLLEFVKKDMNFFQVHFRVEFPVRLKDEIKLLSFKIQAFIFKVDIEEVFFIAGSIKQILH